MERVITSSGDHGCAEAELFSCSDNFFSNSVVCCCSFIKSLWLWIPLFQIINSFTEDLDQLGLRCRNPLEALNAVLNRTLARFTRWNADRNKPLGKIIRQPLQGFLVTGKLTKIQRRLLRYVLTEQKCRSKKS